MDINTLTLRALQFFGMVSKSWFYIRRVFIVVLALTILSDLNGQSSSQNVVVQLKDGSSFSGKVIQKEKDGLLIKTKYGNLKIPGKDIAGVNITISINSYDAWDQSIDSLMNALKGSEPPLKEETNEETTETIQPDKTEKSHALITKKAVSEEVSAGNDDSIEPEPPMVFIPYDEPPKPLSPIRPVYPKLAQEAGIEGTVYVQAFINFEGKVTHAKILKGIPRTGLDESSLNAIRNTRFQPALYEGAPVGVWMTIPVTYKLK